jgi:hypothetical protein
MNGSDPFWSRDVGRGISVDQTEASWKSVVRQPLYQFWVHRLRPPTATSVFAEIPYVGTDEPLLYSGQLERLLQFLKETDRQFTPEYWWPADRSWCVCSDYDLPFTIVAGSKRLIDSILTKADLESIQVTPDTRVDYRAPIE